LLPPIKDETSIKPEKILICAPSNAAIDEIIRKISEKGLMDASGNAYIPSLVRIGPNYHPSLRMFALEYLIEKEKEANPGKQTENIQNEVFFVQKYFIKIILIDIEKNSNYLQYIVSYWFSSPHFFLSKL